MWHHSLLDWRLGRLRRDTVGGNVSRTRLFAHKIPAIDHHDRPAWFWVGSAVHQIGVDERDWHTHDGKVYECLTQLPISIAAPGIGRDTDVRSVAQCCAHQTTQYVAWANFDKDPYPRRVHRLNLLLEAHRLHQLAGQHPCGGERLGRVDITRGVGIHRQLGGTKRRAPDELGKWSLGVSHQRCMERSRHRQNRCAEAVLGEHGACRGDRLCRATQYDLFGCVVVGDPHTFVAPHEFGHARGIAAHRQHRARIKACTRISRRCHRPAARIHQRSKRLIIKRTSRPERGQLAKAMTCQDIRRKPGVCQRAVQAGAQCTNCRLCTIGALERRCCRCRVSTRLRVHDACERPAFAIAEVPLEQPEGQPHLGRVDRRLATHIHIL